MAVVGVCPGVRVEPIEEEDTGAFSVEVGRRLRAVRRAKGMSLDDVEKVSGGRWSASAIGAYERGFRNLSLPRLRDLAEFYDVPMAILLGEGGIAEGGARSGKVMLDLEVLTGIEEAAPILRYLRTIIIERGDFNGKVLSIRRDDLRAMCAFLQADEPALFAQLETWGALRSGSPNPD